jgi:hypothetical protein
VSLRKAQQASVLVQRYHQVKNDPERLAALDRINDLYRGLECRHDTRLGLAIFITQADVTVPKALSFGANIIIQVDAKGLGTILKCKVGKPGERMTAVDLAKSFNFSLTVPDGLRLTRWAAIDEDWI